LYFVPASCLTGSHYRDKKLVGVFVRFIRPRSASNRGNEW
jgi:hypothetical protein